MPYIINDNYIFKYKKKDLRINIINPLLENYRYKIYRKLEQDFINFFVNKKLIIHDKQRDKVIKAFARWIMLQISFNNNLIDPLIPSKLNNKSYKQLEEDIINFTKDKNINTKEIIKELNLEIICNKYIKNILDFIKEKNIISFDKNIILNVNLNDDHVYIINSDNTKTIEIYKEVYDRIKILFITNQSFSQNLLHNDNVFHYILYCLMLRYITISEDGVRQGCMKQSFFDDLYCEFGINYEMFAASFAASTNYICSLFYDIEQYFGSYGNFFDLLPIKGFYQCNPPLDLLITNMAMERVLNILENNNNKYMLGFMCIIPAWDHETNKYKINKYDDFPIYYTLKKSKFLIYNHDIINKKITYYQYQQKNNVLGDFNSPHIIILGNNKFKETFNKNNLIKILNKYIK